MSTEAAAVRGPRRRPAPAWAVRERRLLAAMTSAVEPFLARYAEPDGTLRFRDRWTGLDGADDPFEAFQAWPLVYALGGGKRLLAAARAQWEAVTRQWTRYGQIHDEFFAAYDWMHHGEGLLHLYNLALADPGSPRDRERAARFADLYAGPGAPNYDADRRLIRSPLTGSRGPREAVTWDDLDSHRWILDMYPPPFEDLPERPLRERALMPVASWASAIPEGRPRSGWTDDAVYAAILERLNERLVRGDVPVNLCSTGLATHAFMLTGDERYRRWALDYLEAWRERTARNGGLLPDNVGPSGRVGELLGGRWWGGYYGYRWPHGLGTVLEPLVIAGANAALLDGDLSHLDLARSQIDAAFERGFERDGVWLVPQRRTDAGWVDPAPVDPTLAVAIWAVSRAPQDAARVRDHLPTSLPEVAELPLYEGLVGHAAQWFQHVHGQRPGYADAILEANERAVAHKLQELEADDQDPATFDVHHWQDRVPARIEALQQLVLGAPLRCYHGGHLHAAVRPFDVAHGRPGLPPDVAVLVERLTPGTVTIALENLGDEPRELVLGAGAYGEHVFCGGLVLDEAGGEVPAPAAEGPALAIALEPRSGARLRLEQRLLARRPSYALPAAPAGRPLLVKGRTPR